MLGFGAVWATLGTLIVLAAPSVRNLTWQDTPPPPAAGSLAGDLKFFTATPRRTSRVCTISHSAFIFISSSAVSVSVFSFSLSAMSAFDPLKS